MQDIKYYPDWTDKEKRIFMIANNTLYLNDRHDYPSALWEILGILDPKFNDPDMEPVLAFIEEERL